MTEKYLLEWDESFGAFTATEFFNFFKNGYHDVCKTTRAFISVKFHKGDTYFCYYLTMVQKRTLMTVDHKLTPYVFELGYIWINN